MNNYHFTRPPDYIKKAKLDNLALVPASLLPFKAQWQAIANSHPQGTVFIILPPADAPQRKTIDKLVAMLEYEGHRVATMPADEIGPMTSELMKASTYKLEKFPKKYTY